jgi:hypothetical protein
MSNPLDAAVEMAEVKKVVKKVGGWVPEEGFRPPEYYKLKASENFAWNWQKCNEMDFPRRMLALKDMTTDQTGKVMFHIVDLLVTNNPPTTNQHISQPTQNLICQCHRPQLLLLEHDMITDPKEYATVKQIMISSISSSNVGMVTNQPTSQPTDRPTDRPAHQPTQTMIWHCHCRRL